MLRNSLGSIKLNKFLPKWDLYLPKIMGKPERHTTISLSCSQKETGAPPAVKLAQPCPLYCKAGIQIRMASHSLPVGGLCHCLAGYSGPHFPDEEGTTLRGQVTWNDHRWYKTKRTRPSQISRSSSAFLYPLGTHTHKYAGLNTCARKRMWLYQF